MPLNSPELIDSPRLHLRQVAESDLPRLLAINGDAEVAKHLGHPPWSGMAEAEAWFNRISTLQREGSALEFVILEKENESLIGRCCLFEYDEPNAQAMLGYTLGRPHWRQGYMREALTALIAYAFDDRGLRRLEARVESPNSASSNLLLRLGFTREGVLRERWINEEGTVDAEVYGLLARKWHPPHIPPLDLGS